MKRIIFLLILFLNVLHIFAVKVVFRFDDPTILGDSITMRVLHLFNEKEIPLTIAMIPCDSAERPYTLTDSAYYEALQKPNIEIALHGYNHANINQHGEFGSLDLAETNRRIKLGKEILETQLDKELVTFIPPFNTTNKYVSQAMLQNGLYILSSDMYDYSYEYGIQYFPETLDKSIGRKGFVSAAVDAIDNAWENEVCVLMFHHYDFEDEVAWQRLSNVIDSCIANPNVELYTLRSLAESGEYSDWYRYRANQLRSGLQKYFLHDGVLHHTWLCLFVHILNALLYAMIPLLLLIGWYRKRKLLYLVAAVCGSVLFGALVLLHMLGPLKLLALDVLCVLILWGSMWLVQQKDDEKK
jgi:peptidoglycan/xylan/chitin deacetylase (PgdA/CDA1 family)